MRIIPVLLVFVLLWVGKARLLPAQSCTYEIDAATLQVDGDELGVQPGETLCLKAGSKEYLFLKNIHGAEGNPVTIVNKGGAVVINTDNFYGIKISGCSYIRLMGSGDPDTEYGIQVQRVGNGAGISVGDLSTDVEIAYTEVAHTAIAGVYAKTDPTCSDFSSTRDKFTMYNFWFHHNYVHDIEDEGLYIGSSKYSGQYLSDCDTTVFPHVLVGTRIFENVVENTGWDGIQVSSAESGCKIHDNVVMFDSQAEEYGQMSGILLGGGSVCKTYNNRIVDGKGDGIDIFGLGNFEVFNNLIVRAGASYHPGAPNDYKHGIYIGNAVTTENALLAVFNNTIVDPKSFGITIANPELKTTYVKNNLVTGPGQFPAAGEAAFINNNVGASAVVSEKNFTKYLSGDVKFVDAEHDDYDLQPSSPAVNYGVDLSSQGINFDILNRSRPFHTYFDAGAFECHDPQAGLKENGNIPFSYRVQPNPFKNRFALTIKTDRDNEFELLLYDISGNLLIYKRVHVFPQAENRFGFDTGLLPRGLYLLKLIDKDHVKTSIKIRKK